MESSFLPYIVAIAWISFLLIIGTFLRGNVKLFQKILTPASLIGGLLGFILINVGLLGVPTTQGWFDISPKTFSLLTFHLFGFSFVGLGLLENKQNNQSENTTTKTLRNTLWMQFLLCFLFAMQALAGYGIFALYQQVFGGNFSPVNGSLLGAGFALGPGQAQAFATVWEAGHSAGEALNATATGLAFAASGFLIAGIIGVLFAYYGISKGWHVLKKDISHLSEEFTTGIMKKGNNPVCSRATTHPANIDNLSFHFAIMIFIYGVAFLFCIVWHKFMPEVLKPMAFGFIFVWAIYISILVRKILTKLGLMHFIDSETIKRITNFSIDFMVCAVFLSIPIVSLQSILGPFIISVICVSLLTLWICLFFGRRMAEYGFERALTMFGYCTGTAASGLMLLRIVDPDFETPVATELGLQNIWGFIFINPLTLIMPFAYSHAWITFGTLIGYFVMMPVLIYALRLIQTKKTF